MKIAQVVPEKLPVPPVKGGAVETSVYEVSKALQHKHDITIFSRPAAMSPNNDITYEWIPFTIIEKLFESIINRFSKLNPLRILAKIHNVFFYSLRVGIRLNNKFDIVHIQNDPNFVPIIKFFNKRSKIILHMHNDHLIVRHIFKIWYSNILKNVDMILGVSNYVKSGIIRLYPKVKNKCFTVYNGTNTNLFKPYSNEVNQKIREKYNIGTSPLILYVGRINFNKGVHILINAMRRVIKQNIPNAKLVIVGSSWFKESKKTKYIIQLERLSEDIKDNILFTGYLSGSILYHLYSSADIFVCPSLWNEPFGLILLEAQASGTPVISTDRGGMPEIVKNGKTGVIIPANNDTILADNIIKLLENDIECRAMGKNGRAVVLKNYDWEHVALNLNKYFSMVVKDNSK